MAIDKVKYRVSKVLPLVYDDTLSYYEVLCKLINKVNECIEVCNENSSNISTLQGNIVTIGDSLGIINVRLQTAEGNITDLQGDVDNMEDSIAGIDSNLTDLAETVSELPTETTILYQHTIIGDNSKEIHFFSPESSAVTSVGTLVIRLNKFYLNLQYKDGSHWKNVVSYDGSNGLVIGYIGESSGNLAILTEAITFNDTAFADTVTKL